MKYFMLVLSTSMEFAEMQYFAGVGAGCGKIGHQDTCFYSGSSADTTSGIQNSCTSLDHKICMYWKYYMATTLILVYPCRHIFEPTGLLPLLIGYLITLPGCSFGVLPK